MVYYTVSKYASIILSWLILGHNREDFWEIPESIIGKFLSVIDAGLIPPPPGFKPQITQFPVRHHAHLVTIQEG